MGSSVSSARSEGGERIHQAALIACLLLATFVWLGKRELDRARAERLSHPYSNLARQLNEQPAAEACDSRVARKRFFSAAVLDRFSGEIRQLWRERTSTGEPNFALLDLGVLKLRIAPAGKPGAGYGSSAWSWEDTYGLIQKIQHDPASRDNPERWRDVDSMVRFLLEKDYGRLMLGKKFLQPRLTVHRFRPNPGVARTGPRELTVRLDPGDFHGREKALRRILEPAWRGPGGYRLRIEWVSGGAYRLRAHHDSSRSFVNHKRRAMEFAHLAKTTTVAHELGHVLGFDDHYYSVWNGRNCYYLQEARLSDLMSSSDRGGITARHWEILDKAYPWGRPGPREIFPYTFGD
jgi:hypothetical protein